MLMPTAALPAAPSCSSPAHGPQPTDDRAAPHQPQPAGAHAFVWLSAPVPQKPGGGAAGVVHCRRCVARVWRGAATGGGSWLGQRVERGIESGVVAVFAGGERVGGGGVVDDASEYPIPLPASPLK